MRRSRIFLIVLIAIVCLTVGNFILFRIYRYFNPYLDREISGQVTLSSQWLEITMKEPLRPERDRQKIIIDIEPPVKLEPSGPSMGLVLPDGSVVIPEVQLIDQDGNIYNLTSPSASFEASPGGAWQRGFGRVEPLPKNKVYTAVRIRCEKPVRCSRIRWRSYNPSDLK